MTISRKMIGVLRNDWMRAYSRNVNHTIRHAHNRLDGFSSALDSAIHKGLRGRDAFRYAIEEVIS